MRQVKEMAHFSISLNDDGDLMVEGLPLGDAGGDRCYLPEQVIREDGNGMAMGMPFAELAALIYFVTDASGMIVEKGLRDDGSPPYEGELPSWIRDR
jgi:hypothetical protein